MITFLLSLIAGAILGGIAGSIIFLGLYNKQPKEITVSIVNKSTNGEPFYETQGASGMDIRAAAPYNLLPHGKTLVKTGLFVSIPKGFELQVRPRSGLALKNGITVLNTPGTIDSDYRGEIGVILYNTTDEAYVINVGERIAQMVLVPIVRAKWNVIDVLDNTLRGAGGFGHTGIK